jgi:methylenetetrahydrofolate dehydrogenase (NADP+)/methenyltetrahydrofolate cyclohydrolase
VRGDHVKAGAVVVDVGMNRVQDAKAAADLGGPERADELARKGYLLVGDVHAPSVREKASALTPVPGGVGPLTIAMLVRNTVASAEQAAGMALPPSGG